MKKKVAKQLNKNKVLVAEAVSVIPVVWEDQVANALNLAPVLGLSWGGEDKTRNFGILLKLLFLRLRG